MSVTGSVSNAVEIAHRVAVNAQGGDTTGIQAPTDPNELQQLSMIIKTWKELKKEQEELSSHMREKKKKIAAFEEMILRIMKKNNIAALDLSSSGGRLLYKKQTTKTTLGQKEMVRLLSEHLKSEQAAAQAIQYMTEHRGSKVKESLRYEKE